jgi:Cu2+-exporting ATPase
MGSGVSFLWSLWIFASMIKLQISGDVSGAHHLLHGLYFESAAMIVTLITVGKTLEAKAKGKTTDAIKSLNKLRPETATLIVDGKEKNVQISEVKKGDIFAVKPGESIPVEVSFGSQIISGSVLKSGYILYEVTVSKSASVFGNLKRSPGVTASPLLFV